MNTHYHICLPVYCCAIFILFYSKIIFCEANNKTENAAENEFESLEDILNRIFTKKYDKNTRPMIKNQTFNVEVSVFVHDMSREIWSDFLELILTLKVTQVWTDDRLNPFTNNQRAVPSNSLVVPKALHDRFWLPETGFDLDYEFHQIYAVLEVHSNRTVNYEQFVKTKIWCPIEYTLFPMDQPNCTLGFGSNIDTTLRYTWKADPNLSLQFWPYFPLPGLNVLGYTRRDQFFDSYHHLLVDIFLKRKFFFYLTRFYLPAFFVVVIAFLPLYLSPDSHSRVGLGVTSVLTMTMLLSSASSDLPNIGQLTLLDIYLFFCFFAVFLSVVEYALIGYYDVIRSKEIEKKEELSKKEDKFLRKIELAEKRSTTVDLLSRQLFPASFALFNVVYVMVCIGIFIYNGRTFVEYQA